MKKGKKGGAPGGTYGKTTAGTKGANVHREGGSGGHGGAPGGTYSSKGGSTNGGKVNRGV